MMTFPKSRNKDLVVQELEKELLIYDLTNNKAYCLNESMAMIWQCADGRNSISGITGQMSKKLKTSVTEEFVRLALDKLQKDDLLENGADFDLDLYGLNRREVIRRIGLTTAAALPVISSVIAPAALSAASFIGLGGACTTSPQCANSNCVAKANFGISPSCCVPGATDTIQPGITYLACSNAINQTTCNNSASICCSNAGTLTPGACAPGFRTCRCNPFP